MKDGAEILRRLINEADAYLARFDGAAGVEASRRGIAAALASHGPYLAAHRPPACGSFDAALAAVSGAGRLVAAIREAEPYLQWVTYDLYGASIGPRFPKAHAFASLLRGDDFELGLFLIEPKTLYRDHRHPAPELYAPLTGPHGWRFGIDTPWETRPAHMPVWNEPMAVHATLVRDVPFLCLFVWTRDVNEPATVVEAADWDGIETGVL